MVYVDEMTFGIQWYCDQSVEDEMTVQNRMPVCHIRLTVSPVT